MGRLLELGDDTIEKIVIDTLADDLQIELNAIEKLEKTKKRKPHQESDLKDSYLLANSLRTVLAYYGYTPPN